MSDAKNNQNHFLFELGTEELPTSFLATAPDELQAKVTTLLTFENSTAPDVEVYVTPRRMTVSVQNLPDVQPARDVQLKGPPVRIALKDDGSPTPAGMGFAKKTGVAFESLTRLEIDGETYLVSKQTLPGKAIPDLLKEELPGLILGLSGSHFMAWGEGKIRFSRPLRWLVSLWNDQVLPVSIGLLTADRNSIGHRLLATQNTITIPSPAKYLELLEAHGAVIADVKKRRSLIWQQLQAKAQELGGQVLPNEDLLETVTMLVEKPFVVAGRFEDRYLDLPQEVIMTVMASHQKYFPLHDASGQKLLPYFLAVSNGKPESADSIRSGNEKVIRARLEDAKFFYADDCEILLENRLEKLKGITFQKGMGTLLDKANRLESLTSKILPYLGVSSEASKADALRAAKLAKTDLVSGMVFEFTELQGIMGYYYASVQKETSNVAHAIKEQYQPNFAGDAIPATECGRIISLVDKLDTLVAVFSRKSAKLPTGSKDPLGLRRMVNGIYQIAMAFQHNAEFDLKRLLEAAYEVVVANSQSESIKDKDFYSSAETLDLITTFFMQRVRSFLSDKGHRFDVIEAAIEVDEPLSEIHSVEKRIAGFEKLIENVDRLKSLYEPANRISNILGAQYNTSASPSDVNAALIKDASEKALYEQLLPLTKALNAQSEFGAYESELAKISPAVEAFFTAVMVNDPDAAVKANRYALLSCLNQYYKKMGTFSKLAV